MASPARSALGWLMRKGYIVPIPGTTKLAHLEENIRAATLDLKTEDWDALEAALQDVQVIGDRYPADQQIEVETK